MTPWMFRSTIAIGLVTALASARAMATPSTTFWAPSTPALQGFGVLHLTYDTYFGSEGLYPIDLGLTMGVLPLKQLQLEVGLDVVYPTPGADGTGLDVPLLFNAKVGTPEDVLFTHQPGWSIGIYNLGLEPDITDYDVLYGMLGKTLPYVGMLSLGGYYGIQETTLLTSSDGDTQRGGFLAGWFSPPIDLPLIDRIHLAADLQTGENALGAVGGGIYIYFTPAIDFLTGPVIFFDPDKQPGGQSWMWTAQVDIDIDFKGPQEGS
jgi:hypothetical protein